MKVTILLLTILLLSINSLKAQSNNIATKKDTLFYLVDTAKTPVRDRLMRIEIEGPWNCFAIECTCLKYNQRPVFVYKLENPGSEPVNINLFRKINFISLTKLIELAKEGGGDIFNEKHIAYFIEKKGHKFIKTKVTLVKPMRREITY